MSNLPLEFLDFANFISRNNLRIFQTKNPNKKNRKFRVCYPSYRFLLMPMGWHGYIPSPVFFGSRVDRVLISRSSNVYPPTRRTNLGNDFLIKFFTAFFGPKSGIFWPQIRMNFWMKFWAQTILPRVKSRRSLEREAAGRARKNPLCSRNWVRIRQSIFSESGTRT